MHTDPAPARKARDRHLVAFLAVAALPILFTLDTLIALARGWHTNSRLDQILMTAMSAALLLALLLFAISGTRAMLARQWRPLVFIAVVVSLLLVAVESLFALFIQPRIDRQIHRREAGMKWTFRPNPEIMPGIVGESLFTTNADGVRGPPMPPRAEAYRILCVGGSTTECIYLDDSETWPALVMAALNGGSPTTLASSATRVWLGNVGISGSWSQDHIDFVRRSELAPEMDCMLFLVGLNDFQKFIGGRMREEQLPPLWRKSALWNLILRSWTAYRRSQGFVEMMFEDVEGSYYKLRRKARQEARKSDALPPLDEALREFRERVKMLAALCRERKVRPVFVTQPVLWKPDLKSTSDGVDLPPLSKGERRQGGASKGVGSDLPPLSKGRAGVGSALSPAAESLLWFGLLADGSYLSAPKLREGIDRYNAALQQAAAECGAECIDLSSLSGREELFYDDAHYNEAGAREVAGIVAERLRDRGT